MKISYRGFTCSQGDVKVFYLFENNINLPKEEINRHVVLAQSRNLFNGKDGELYTFTIDSNESIQTIILVGLGKEEQFTIDVVRKATAKPSKKLRN